MGISCPSACLSLPQRPQVAFGAALAGSSEDFRPQQAFLRLTSRDSGAAAFFAAVRAKDGSLYATAKSADVQKQVGGRCAGPCSVGGQHAVGQAPPGSPFACFWRGSVAMALATQRF